MVKVQKKAIRKAIIKAGKKSDIPLLGQIIKLIPLRVMIKCVKHIPIGQTLFDL